MSNDRIDVQPPVHEVRRVVAMALTEDLAPLGDITASLLPPGVTATARVVARDDGLVAGLRCAQEAFFQVDDSLVWSAEAQDGDHVKPGQSVAVISGTLASILTAERTALNLVCHLSGVATLTRRYVDAAEAASGGHCRIWDTRKTTPGLRSLEKAAVRAGGGRNHRGSLSEMVLIKDNHLARLGITDAVRLAHQRWPGRAVEVECERIGQVREAVLAGAELVMLDNMAPDRVEACVALVIDLGRESEIRRPLVEVSGGVNLDNVADYAAAGPDLISVGALTHSAPVLDLGLDVGEAG